MTEEVAKRTRELIRRACEELDIEIVQGHVAKDHVHLLLSMPPDVSVSKAMQRIKGKSSHHLLNEFAHLRKQYYGQHFWARGYFACSSGNVTDDMIKAYIAEHAEEDNPNFRIDGE